MNRELAAYLFFDVPLYKNPLAEVAVPQAIGEQGSRSSSTVVEKTTPIEKPVPPVEVLQTSKKHAWFFGEKPVGEKKELLVKLLSAVHLKGSDVVFFFEKYPVYPFVEANTTLESVFIFGTESVIGELMQPLNQPQLLRGTSLILTYSLDQLVVNTTDEKRNLWTVLKKVYLDK